MVDICKLTKRQVDPDSKKLDNKLEQVKIFSLSVGHGIGSIDYVEKIDTLSDEEFEKMLSECGEYAKFKLGNLTKYFEIEIYPEHINKLLSELPECKFKTHLQNTKEGYLILRKSS